jgi:ammonium transporter, Amt family
LAVHAAANTTLAAGAGGLSALAFHFLATKHATGQGKYDLVASMNGVLANCVAVMAGCSLIILFAAIVVGGLAGGFYLVGSHLLICFQLDVAVDAVHVHLVKGIWGLLAVGLFSTPELAEMNYGHDDVAGLFFPIGEKVFPIGEKGPWGQCSPFLSFCNT